MGRYAVWSDTESLPLGHFDTEKRGFYPYAREHTLCDISMPPGAAPCSTTFG